MTSTHVLTPKTVTDVIGPLPKVATPTVLVWLGCTLLQAVSMYLVHYEYISPLICFVLCTAAIFGVFTPMHDASHGSVAIGGTPQRMLNEMVGICSGLCFPIPFGAFRHLHLVHHKHTNDPDNDPDAYAGHGPALLLPLRWLTIEIKYYMCYLGKVFTGERPLIESIVSVITMAGYIVGSYLLIQAGYARVVIFGMLLPGRLAIGLLAFFFDYLPHRPHAVSRAANEYVATGVASLHGDWTSPLTWPLFHQNYHIIHHLAPYVPFYYYSTLWYAYKDELIQHGTSVKALFGGNDSAIAALCSLGDVQKSASNKKRI